MERDNQSKSRAVAKEIEHREELEDTVEFHCNGVDYKLDEQEAVARWIIQSIEQQGYRIGTKEQGGGDEFIPSLEQINIIFCSKEKHIEINRNFLGHDYHTDVITFDYGELTKGGVAGDIFIDPETVKQNAQRYGVSEKKEMLRVIIHGVLHLCGHKDETEEEKKQIRKQEDKYLRKI